MRLRLLSLLFLVGMVAVYPVFAFIPHSSFDIHLRKNVTSHFGNDYYVLSAGVDITITSLWTNSTNVWFNYTFSEWPDVVWYGGLPVGGYQTVYYAEGNATAVYVNDTLYTTWVKGLGSTVVFDDWIYPDSNVSIFYENPTLSHVTLWLYGYDENGTVLNNLPVTLIDNNNTETYTVYTGTQVSIVNETSVTLNVQDIGEYHFLNWTSYPPDVPNVTFTIRSDVTMNIFYYFWEAAFLLPIMFIVGMTGLGCMFVGPMWAINKLKEKQYRSGFVWGVIITMVGIALVIAWVWGGQ